MIDLTAMLINLSNSMQPIQKLLSGMGYLFGLISMIIGLGKLKNVLQSRQGNHQEGVGAGVVFILGGALLVYLPSSVSVFSNTFFGVSNVLSYSSPGVSPLYHAMMVIVETAGLLWFVRGTFLILGSTKPGDNKIGPKGLAFLVAGILAMNIEATISALTATLTYVFELIAGRRH